MNREMLMLVDAIAREKNVERDLVFAAVESALAQATKKLLQSEGFLVSQPKPYEVQSFELRSKRRAGEAKETPLRGAFAVGDAFH